jgi:hypothetical protein
LALLGIPCHRPDALIHTEAQHATTRNVRCLRQIISSAGEDGATDKHFSSTAAEQHRHPSSSCLPIRNRSSVGCRSV